NSSVSVDSRESNNPRSTRFCGGSALGASGNREYATFMRFAFRSSLSASFTLHNLGFRCASNSED
ncbi:MAG: hypothetical protein KC561_01330, partial [Myxococcales bacterium]|nr:hypothetical protein [Myxococcales bacterium]